VIRRRRRKADAVGLGEILRAGPAAALHQLSNGVALLLVGWRGRLSELAHVNTGSTAGVDLPARSVLPIVRAFKVLTVAEIGAAARAKVHLPTEEQGHRVLHLAKSICSGELVNGSLP
jgi:hypothetical protein